MRTILDPNDIHPTIKDEVANFQSAIVQEVSKTVAENRIVIVGMLSLIHISEPTRR